MVTKGARLSEMWKLGFYYRRLLRHIVEYGGSPCSLRVKRWPQPNLRGVDVVAQKFATPAEHCVGVLTTGLQCTSQAL